MTENCELTRRMTCSPAWSPGRIWEVSWVMGVPRKIPRGGWFFWWKIPIENGWMMTGGTPIGGNPHLDIYVSKWNLPLTSEDLRGPAAFRGQPNPWRSSWLDPRPSEGHFVRWIQMAYRNPQIAAMLNVAGLVQGLIQDHKWMCLWGIWVSQGFFQPMVNLQMDINRLCSILRSLMFFDYPIIVSHSTIQNRIKLPSNLYKTSVSLPPFGCSQGMPSAPSASKAPQSSALPAFPAAEAMLHSPEALQSLDGEISEIRSGAYHPLMCCNRVAWLWFARLRPVWMIHSFGEFMIYRFKVILRSYSKSL